MSFRRLAALSVLALAVVVRGSSADDPSSTGTARIKVDASSDLGPVNTLVFGHNIEAGDGAGIFSGTVIDDLRAGNGFWDPRTREPNPAVLARMKELRTGMLRYPGGCLAHNYDWRKAVGPVAQRGDWKFGIPEFIALCRAVGAEPMFTVSDYVLPADQMPQHAADLVEFLNAPATPDHPWAMKRKEWGNPEPFGVKWFELGNESDHGNHHVVPARRYTPDQYADYALATAKAMRAVDPTIKIGITTVPGNGTNFDCAWNRTVLHRAGPAADFVIVHLYAPSVGPAAGITDDQRELAAMATADQVETYFKKLDRIVLEETGRKMPYAVTEYNAVIESSLRFSYGAGLASADFLRFFLEPGSRVANAEYWNVLNGWFGMLRTATDGSAREPMEERGAWAPFKLWGEHFGDRLTAVNVASPTAEFAGAGSARPAHGDKAEPGHSLGFRDVAPHYSLAALENDRMAARVSGGVLSIKLHNLSGNFYPAIATLSRSEWGGEAASGGLDYHLVFEARYVPAPGEEKKTLPALGLGLVDVRGWEATHSAVAIMGISSGGWASFSGSLPALDDASAINVVARLESVGVALNGTLEVRDLRLEAARPQTFPAYRLVTASASRSADGKTLFLILFNKSADKSVPADIGINGFAARSARYWEVNAPALTSTSARETVSGRRLELDGGRLHHVLPAHSMTAIEFYDHETQADAAVPIAPSPTDSDAFSLDLNDSATRVALEKQGGVITHDGPGGTPAVRFTVDSATQPGLSSMASFPIGVAPLRGTRVALTALVRSENIRGADSSRPLPDYLGGKCQLALDSPDSGKRWLDTRALHGTFDWRPASVMGDVWESASGGAVRIGLEKATGTIWLTNVRLRVLQGRVTRPVPAPAVAKAVAAARTILRGVMSPNSYREKDFDDLAAWNVNVMRWQMGQATGDITPYEAWLAAKLDELDYALDGAARHGIRLAVDLHSPPGGRLPDRTMRMFLDKKYADEFVALWEGIARRFKGRSGLWAYDLVNEPVQNQPSPEGLDDWLGLQVRAAKAIREIDPTTPIIIETDQWDSPESFARLKPVDVPGIIYEAHMYWPGEYTHQGVRTNQGIADEKDFDLRKIAYPGTLGGALLDKEALRRYLQSVRDFQLATGAPIFIGEFSAVRWAPGASRYLNDCISLFEEYGWNWTYHAFREWGGWDVERADLPFDRTHHPLATQPTDREKVLLKWFSKNQRSSTP